MTTTNYAKSIVLPCDEVFRNLKNAKRFAIDIGGSLAKLAYSSTVQKKSTLLSPADNATDGNSLYEVSETKIDGIRLHFIKFETRYIERCLEFIEQRQETSGSQEKSTDESTNKTSKIIKTTGGGSHKYFQLISEKLKLRVDKEDEMECLIKGCNFLLRNIPDESFTFHYHDAVQYRFQTVDPCHIFPYLLVNIGSGVSIVKVESDEKYERVGGTSFGGGSFWGLGSLLTKARGFDELLKLAEEGDHRDVDMLVSDIYGGAYEKLGLPGDLIASSFGKMIKTVSRENNTDKEEVGAKEADIARSLLLTISNCIGQIAVLYASMHQLKRIYFGGYFIRGHPITMRTISYAINYWSKGEIQALFLRHEGYLGAVGAFLKGAEEDSKPNTGPDTTALYSWTENYAGSSGLGSSVPAAFLSQNGNAFMCQLEMDCAQQNLVPCPLLLSPETYTPDSVDLTQDNEARDYWLECLENGVEKTVKKAIDSQPQNREDAKERAQHFRHRYVQHLRLLRQHPL